MVAESPALRARLRELFEHREAALARALAAEPDGDGFSAILQAALIAAVDRLLFAEALHLALDGVADAELAGTLAAEADQAFGRLEPAIGEAARR